MRKTLTLLVAVLAVALLAPLTASAQGSAAVVDVQFSGLEPLGEASVYEGWLVINGAPVSTGTFNLDAQGNFVNVINKPVANAASATAYVLSIEPAVDPDPAPADTKVLGGAFVNGVAQLSISHPAALATDFSDTSGGYIIATPTTASTDDDLSGVWFLDPTAGPGPSLNLSPLPAGWEYEGWAVIDGQVLSTGRFTSATGPDSFSGFSGPDGSPPFPGEDFIVNAPSGLTFPTDLSGQTIVISVEPQPDDSPAPFALKPLVSTVASDVTIGAVNPFGKGPVAITGTASINNTPAAAGAAGAAAPELAFTGAESWYLAGAATLAIAMGAAFVMTSRRFETATVSSKK